MPKKKHSEKSKASSFNPRCCFSLNKRFTKAFKLSFYLKKRIPSIKKATQHFEKLFTLRGGAGVKHSPWSNLGSSSPREFFCLLPHPPHPPTLGEPSFNYPCPCRPINRPDERRVPSVPCFAPRNAELVSGQRGATSWGGRGGGEATNFIKECLSGNCSITF